MTGAPVPRGGADTVVRQERHRTAATTTVEIRDARGRGEKNVRSAR